MRTKIRSFFVFWLETAMIVTVTLLGVLPVSCKVTETGIRMINGDYVCPKLISYYVEDSKTVRLVFSEPVDLKSHVVFSKEELKINSELCVKEKSNEVCVKLESEMCIGEKYQLLGVVKDEYGNSLTFELPFTGYNERVPKLLITEIQTVTVSSRTKKEIEEDLYKNEFVEFLALSDGNLSGIELVSAYDGEDRIFEMPVVEVHQGEVVTVHLRNKGKGCLSELGDNLNLAFAPYSKDGVRDLWTVSSETALGNKTDVVYLRNSANGKVLDALLYCESKYEQWSGKYYDYVKIVEDCNIYDSVDCTDVINGDVLGKTKTLQRMNAKKVLNEFVKNGDSAYPVKNDKSYWEMADNTAGSL